MKSQSYVPALAYAPLTRFYDVVVGLTTREATFKKALIAQAEINDGARIIDVACGTGTLALMLKMRYPDVDVVGLDGDTTVLKIARKKFEKEAVSVQLDEGLSYEMPYSDEEFDMAMSSLFFHHLSYEMKERTAREMYRILRPGGELHIADWGKPGNRLMSLLFYGIQMLDGFENTDDNRKGALLQIFGDAGFNNLMAGESFSTIFGTMALYSGTKYA